MWDVEAEKWRPDLSITIVKGEPATRHELIKNDSSITVIGQDNLGDILKVRRGTPFKTFIVDELSGYKARGSKRWKIAKRIAARAAMENVWGLTGTPAPNGLIDLWAQIYLLDGGQRLGVHSTPFIDKYFTPDQKIDTARGLVTVSWKLREGAEQQIWELLDDICLSMESEGRIELPPVTYNDIEIELPSRAKDAYNEIRKQLLTDLTDIFGGHVHTAANAAILSARLSQICAGFVFVDEAEFNNYEFTWIHDESIKAVKEVIDGALGSPVLVAYRFIPERDKILEALGDKAHTIDEPDVIKRWNRGEIPVLVAHPKSVGHGLNLQEGGHTVIWASPTWSLEYWEQLNKRVARQGQKHPVVIHSIMRRGTVDKLIRKRLDDKGMTQDALMDYLESPV